MSAFLTVTKKELQDHINSWRFLLLLFIIVAAIIYVYFAIANVKLSVTGTTEFIFLRLTLMATLIPVAGIVLGLDAINSERNNGTLSRLVSQPIYRDNIINAKFLAGIITITIVLLSILLLTSGLGIWQLGIAPGGEEIARLFFFLIIAIIYGGFWLGLAILFSTLLNRLRYPPSYLSVSGIFCFLLSSHLHGYINQVRPLKAYSPLY
jgi:ABC-2 type transport system permease protein